MTKRERKHVEILKERCAILRARIGEGHSSLNYINNWRRELEAMEWVLGRVTGGEQCES